MAFPDDWPADCPPADAEAAQGDVYRVVKSNPLTADDFLTHQEMGTAISGPPCLRCGLSVFRVAEDASHLIRAYPKLSSLVARGTLQAEHGMTKQTRKPSHTTWRVCVGVDRVALFAVIGELS